MMQAIIDVFKMSELRVDTRIKIIKRLGHAINNQYGCNSTEPLVYELVLALDPHNEIKDDKHYLAYL